MRMSRPLCLLAAAIAVTQPFPVAAQVASAPVSTAAKQPAQAGQPSVLTGSHTRKSVLGEIQGKALDSANAVLPRRTVRLRGTRTGRIADIKPTDAFGVFKFSGVEPGNYVVELLGDREDVLAASPLVTVDSGNAISTVVKLPIQAPMLGGLLGSKVSTAAIIAGTAAAAGVLSVRVSNCVSPPCGT